MDAQDFLHFRHEAVHELTQLNELCQERFHISDWPRWNYDLDCGTLTFFKDGVPKVQASIQAVGTTSISSKTWLWAWANEYLPSNVKKGVEDVRAFGERENISELTKAKLPDDEHLGWEMTAISARILRARGAYRCQGDNGFLYVVYSSIGFVS